MLWSAKYLGHKQPVSCSNTNAGVQKTRPLSLVPCASCRLRSSRLCAATCRGPTCDAVCSGAGAFAYMRQRLVMSRTAGVGLAQSCESLMLKVVSLHVAGWPRTSTLTPACTTPEIDAKRQTRRLGTRRLRCTGVELYSSSSAGYRRTCCHCHTDSLDIAVTDKCRTITRYSTLG